MKKLMIAAAIAGVSQFALAGGSVGLTCSNYQGTETLTDFPMLVRISSEAIEGFSYEGLTEDLISFKDAAGNELPCEIDTWNPNGESLVWVKVPSLTQATKVLLSWGEARTTTSTDVWSGYKGVWHFNEGTVGPYKSSGATANNASLVNHSSAVASEQAKVGTGVAFQRGTKKQPTLTAPAVTVASGGAVTFSGWWRLDQLYSDPATAAKDESWPKMFCFGGYNYGGFYLQCGDNTASDPLTCNIMTSKTDSHQPPLGSSTELLGSKLHHLAVTIKPGESRFYIDGKVVDSSENGIYQVSNAQFWLLGEVYKATVDEVRLRYSAVSEDWIKADYQQQDSADGALYVVGGAKNVGSVALACSNYKGNEPLTDFPMLVRLSPGAIRGFSYDWLTSDLISFKDANGNELPCEIDTWNPDGESLVWVKVPSLTKRTKVTLCWGEARTTSSIDVWSAYRGVYHFEGDPVNTRLHSKSAAMNASDDLYAELASNSASQQSVDAALGKGFTITRKGTGTTTMLEVPSGRRIGLQQSEAVTVSGWWRLDQLRTESENYPRLFAFGGYGFGGFYVQCGDNQMNNTFTCEVVKEKSKSTNPMGIGADSTEALGGPSLHHVAVAFRNGEQRVYIDGELKASAAHAMVPFTAGPFALVDGVNKATVDEVRLQLVSASEDWIKADYQQQASAEGSLYDVVRPGLVIILH